MVELTVCVIVQFRAFHPWAKPAELTAQYLILNLYTFVLAAHPHPGVLIGLGSFLNNNDVLNLVHNLVASHTDAR